MRARRLFVGALLCALSACEEDYGRSVARPPPQPVSSAPLPHTTVYTTPPPPAPPAAQKPVLRFLQVRGHVTMNHMPVTEPVTIPENAELATGPDGTAFFTMMPGSAMLMRPATTLALAHNSRGIDVKLHQGSLWSFIPKDGVYQVSTPAGTAAAHGTQTQFYVHLDKRKNVDICDCHGDVQMSTPDGHTFNKVIESPEYEHEGIRFQRKGRRFTPKRLTQLAHVDDGNDDLVEWAAKTVSDKPPAKAVTEKPAKK